MATYEEALQTTLEAGAFLNSQGASVTLEAATHDQVGHWLPSNERISPCPHLRADMTLQAYWYAWAPPFLMCDECAHMVPHLMDLIESAIGRPLLDDDKCDGCQQTTDTFYEAIMPFAYALFDEDGVEAISVVGFFFICADCKAMAGQGLETT